MRAAALALALVAACGGKPEPRATPVVPGGTPAVLPKPGVSRALLSELAVFATATPPAPAQLDDWAARIDSGKATLEGYIDALLARPEFGRVIAPSIIGVTKFRAINLDRQTYYQLKTTKAGDGSPIVYLTKPCTEKEAVAVEPWWALGTTIKVCPAAYRPDVWSTARGKRTVACNSSEGAPTFDAASKCGCGPSLIRCFLDVDLEKKRKKESRDELTETIAYVAEHDLPFQTLFSGTATYRRRLVEGVYRWQQIETEKRADAASLLRDLAKWPEAGAWAERPELAPGQHAGMLTSLALLYFTVDRRQRQRDYSELLWCTGAGRLATGVKNEDLLALKAHLQTRVSGNEQTSWQELARRPICTTCHARMDYGSQFFNGYPAIIGVAAHFVPALHEAGKTGPLYIHDKDDLRGDAPLTPAGFAALAMKQPEFAHCMASKFASHVFGTETTEDDIAVVAKLFATPSVTVRSLARAALVRYTQRPPPAAGEPAHTPVAPAGEQLAPALRARLGDVCGDCHTKGADIPDLELAVLPRALLLRSLDLVGSEFMPKGHAMALGERLELVHLLIDQLWTDKQQREQAYETIAGQLELPTTYRWATLQHAIDAGAGVPNAPPWAATENAVHGEQSALTPNIGVMTTLEAIRACKKAGKTGAELTACVTRAQSLLAR